MKIKKLLFTIFVATLCFACINKKTAEIADIIDADPSDIEKPSIYNFTLYVAPSDGLNLRSESSLTGTIIKLLPQNTELTILERSKEKETINNLHDYWYMIDTGNETGWVFGGYLSSRSVDARIRNAQIAKMIAESEHSRIFDDWILSIDGSIKYFNKDTLLVYTSSTKESNYSFADSGDFYLFKLENTPEWFYIFSQDFNTQGYINLYDISERSFYGDFEENEKTNNWYSMLLEREYEIVQQNQNVKRYGPLLLIRHNGNYIEFLDTFNGLGGKLYLLLDYYTEHNEILISEQYYEGGKVSIYNLEFKEYRCDNLAYHHLYFNESRTYLFSLDWSYGGEIFAELKIFKINDGIYHKLFDKEIYGLSSTRIINNISWINDHEVKIDCITGTVQVLINNEVEVINNLEYE